MPILIKYIKYKSEVKFTSLLILYTSRREEELCGEGHNDQKGDVHRCKNAEILLGLLRMDQAELVVGYQAGERGNKGARTADVDS